MKSWSICAAVVAVVAVLGSVLLSQREQDVHTFTRGMIHVSPRLYLTTRNGGIGILESYWERAVNVRQYETRFCLGEHFFSLPFRAPVAASFVAIPAACIALLLWVAAANRRTQ